MSLNTDKLNEIKFKPVHSGKSDVCYCDACRNARLDAYKAGMTAAADVLQPDTSAWIAWDARKAILTARDNLKEIP